MAIQHAIPLHTADPILLSMRNQEEGIAALHDALLERTEKSFSTSSPMICHYLLDYLYPLQSVHAASLMISCIANVAYVFHWFSLGFA